MKIQIKKLSEKAVIPTQGSKFSAGYDLYSTEDYTLKPGERHLFKTNISLTIPEGTYGRIASRSGLSYKNGIDVLGGVVDCDYQGDIGVILLNTSIYIKDSDGISVQEGKPLTVKAGDRIAQIIFEHYNNFDFEEVGCFDFNTERKDGGFGSSGK